MDCVFWIRCEEEGDVKQKISSFKPKQKKKAKQKS
jgi:hypothetical protein